MSKKIKITMLGTTQAGKTCYMMAMYAKMSEGINGFTLSSDDLDTDIELIDQWDSLTYSDGENHWPDPTDKNYKYYSFNFNYALTTKVIDFDWLDYRGGALRSPTADQDVSELVDRIKNSSCIFLCIPGGFLSGDIDASTIRKAGIARMKLFLKQLGSTGKTVPISIIITKYDLCAHRQREDVINDIKKLFGEFFLRDSNWQVMICPVTLGLELADSTSQGTVEPVNVHLPLIFAIYFDYLNAAVALRVRQEEFKDELNSTKDYLSELNNRNWFSRTWDRVGGDKLEASTQEEIARIAREREEIQGQVFEIQDKLNLLRQELNHKDISIYINGEEVEIDV